MRYEPAEKLVRLIIDLAGSRTGLTLSEIEERFQVSRRTAERLLSAARRTTDVEELQPLGDRRKRWRVERPPPILMNPGREDLAALGTAIARLEADGLADRAERLTLLRGRLAAAVERVRAAAVETDVDVLAEAEGFASRPGPRPLIDRETFSALREAILAARKVKLHYLYRSGGGETVVTVHPYGFLYGSRHYLVAFSEAASAQDIRLFALPNIRAVRALEAAFSPPEGFTMADFTRQMFGVFREPPYDVVWRFSAEAAADAASFRFHPDQRADWLDDGRLEVSFRAGGLREMAWHLFTWGKHVEIVEPAALREELVGMLREALGQHAHP